MPKKNNETKANCLLNILQLLIEGKKLTTTDISKLIDKDIRTSQRYIKNLIEMNLPIERDNKFQYYYENKSEDDKIPFYLPKNDVYMIYLALISFSAFGKDSLIVNSILEKLETLLAPADRAMLSQFKENIVVKNRNELLVKDKSMFNIFIALMYSFSRKRLINMSYKSKNGIKNHLLEIFGFCLAKETYYVVGKSSLSNNILIFRLDRIESFEEENKEYALPNNFNVKNHFKFAWEVELSREIFEFKLEFYNDALANIEERIWCIDQIIDKSSSEKTIFYGKTQSYRELKKWILGFGANIKVLEPNWLKKDIVEEYNKVFLNYTG